jgi:membrane protein
VRRSASRALGGVARSLRERAGRSDVMVVAAALTCYAAFGLIPLLAIATRIAAWCFGADEVVATANGVAGFLHGPLGLGHQVVAFARQAAQAPGWSVLVALLPVSLYAEGTVRSLERFSRAPERHSRTLRGRLLTPVFVSLVTLFVVVAVGLLQPLLSDPFGRGIGARLLGIFVGFNLLFFAVFGSLLIIYRLFASTPLRRGPLAIAAFAAASWIAGQTLGYVVAVRAVSGFDNAFGGYAPAAEVAALSFLIYLQHLIFVFGYLLALVLHEDRGASSGRPDVGGDGPRRQRDEG